MNSHQLFPDGLALSRGIELAIAQGYSFVDNAISDTACQDLKHEADELDLQLGDHITEPIHAGSSREITQMHERAYLPIGHEDVPVATFVTRALSIRIQSLRYRYPVLRQERWMATEAGYQHYRDPNHHISKHRDRRTDKLLAATITIVGAASIGVHEPINDPEDYTNTRKVDEHRAKAGTIMFLRAPGLGSGEQVIHDVSPPEGGPRLILNLRMRPDILQSPSEVALK